MGSTDGTIYYGYSNGVPGAVVWGLSTKLLSSVNGIAVPVYGTIMLLPSRRLMGYLSTIASLHPPLAYRTQLVCCYRPHQHPLELYRL